MSSDLDVLARLRTDPAPAMAVDLERVTALGQQRLRRHAARWVTVVAAGAVAATVAAVMVFGPDDRRTTTPPAGTSTTTAKDLSTSGNGGAEIAGKGGVYGIWVTAGIAFTQLTLPGQHRKFDDHTGVVLPSGAMWLVVQGTQGWPVILGVVPAGATNIALVPLAPCRDTRSRRRTEATSRPSSSSSRSHLTAPSSRQTSPGRRAT